MYGPHLDSRYNITNVGIGFSEGLAIPLISIPKLIESELIVKENKLSTLHDFSQVATIPLSVEEQQAGHQQG
jgi:hypothetical protein